MNYLFANIILVASFLIYSLTTKQMRLHLVHLCLFLIVLLYWISVFIAADVENAILEAIKITTILPFAILFSALSKEQMMKIFRWIPYMGAFLVVIGVIFQLERQQRLESTIGYANALAIFLLVSLLMSIFFYMKKASKIDFILMIIQATGLLLTFSRSVWVLWIVSVAALALFQEFRKRNMWLRIMSIHVFSFIIAALLKWDMFFFWSRLKTIQPETSEFQMRLMYWKDSLPMITDYFWLGTGGGGWSVWQSFYQSEGYFVRFVHNHYLQLALDIGVFGSLLFILIAIILYYRSFALYKSLKTVAENSSLVWIKGVVLASTVLLLHAGFDFDFSFLFILALFLMFVEYIMVQSPDMATRLINPSKSVKAILSICLVVMLFFTSWMEVGKYFQMRGQSNVTIGNMQSAIQDYSIAQKLMPWAASTYYDMAKVYVLLGNKSGNRNDYLEGKKQVEQAVHRLPHEKLYQQLNEDLYENLMKE
ncbi:O-antigen ligase family protein [Paenibacillus sp. P36]|uniref:O-antigen ligase family protein n=1 Tax=Paenibacillus sp. P36 TaxID=3342538 RepID=UPI0038B2499C